MEEIWKDIKFTDTDGKEYDYTGLYQVSNLGKVRSLDRTVMKLNNGTLCEVKYNGKVLKQGYCEGYFHVVLCKDGARKQMGVHRLVAHMFIENHNTKEFIIVNHKDENPSNNVWTNLEWCTPQYNVTYGTAIKRGSKRRSKTMKKYYETHDGTFTGKKHTEQSKNKISESRKGKYTGDKNPVAKKVLCVETGKIYATLKEAAQDMNVGSGNICSCCKGKLKTTGGFHWQYVD